MKPTLSTERLVLRPFRADDARNLCDLDADPEVRRFVDQPEPPTLEHCESVVSRIRAMDESTPEVGFWIAEERGEFIGWFHLKPPREGEPAEPGDLEIGYRLLRSAWGRGLATEGSQMLVARAFEVLDAPRVTAVALTDHTASIRIMSKLGMTLWRKWEYRSRSGAMLPIVTYARSR